MGNVADNRRGSSANTKARATSKARVARRRPSRLHEETAARIVSLLKDERFSVGQHLVADDLCKRFGISRTPIHGALRLLETRGLVENRPHRGFVLSRPLDTEKIEVEPAVEREDEDARLFVAIADARIAGQLPDQCTQQELVRRFGVHVGVVVRVLRELAKLGLAERKAGNGWRFLPTMDSTRAEVESYQFRMTLEPVILLQPGFALDGEWARRVRMHHDSFLHRPWKDTLAVEFYEMNAEFHEGLARASGNRHMLGAIQQQNQLRRFLNYQWQYPVERVRESVLQHLAILTALESDDRDFAAVLMRRHLASAPGASQAESR